MKTSLLKKIFLVLLLTSLYSFNSLFAQDITTVKAANLEIAENLDLKLVASLFGESKNLEDFENKLNDYEIQASNLDLNNDDEVDYLRVIDILEDGVHVIVIQAVIGVDKYQDVAEIDVQKNSEGLTEVQIIGDSELYGDDYIIEPNYISTPEIFLWFLGIHYRVWYSPYYWGHYPKRHRHWKRHSRHHYKKRSRKHRNINISYKYAKSRRNKKAKQIRRKKKNFNRVVTPSNSNTEYKKRKVRDNWKSSRDNSSNSRVYVHSSNKHDNSTKYKRSKKDTSNSFSNQKSRKNRSSSWGTSNKSNRNSYRKEHRTNRNSYKKEKTRTYKSEKKSRRASKPKKSRSYKKSKSKKSKSYKKSKSSKKSKKSKSSKSDKKRRR